MKNFLFIFLLISQITLAQTNVLNSGNSPDNIVSRSEQLNFLLFQMKPGDSRNMSMANNVYIVQIGNYNKVTSNTRSRNSNINLYQRGNNNNVLLSITARTIDESVIQRGYNHSFINLSLNKANFHRAKAIQLGRNQKLLWVGSNSISEKLMVRMKGNNQKVIIRNFKR
ncbi:MAG: hypothetical protein O6943_01800 [Bacteroidetes bacterium]|nr:hypothetical protein [Bacteroidota bacterium]